MVIHENAVTKVVRDTNSINKEIKALRHMADAGQLPRAIVEKRIAELEKLKSDAGKV